MRTTRWVLVAEFIKRVWYKQISTEVKNLEQRFLISLKIQSKIINSRIKIFLFLYYCTPLFNSTIRVQKFMTAYNFMYNNKIHKVIMYQLLMPAVLTYSFEMCSLKFQRSTSLIICNLQSIHTGQPNVQQKIHTHLENGSDPDFDVCHDMVQGER